MHFNEYIIIQSWPIWSVRLLANSWRNFSKCQNSDMQNVTQWTSAGNMLLLSNVWQEFSQKRILHLKEHKGTKSALLHNLSYSDQLHNIRRAWWTEAVPFYALIANLVRFKLLSNFFFLNFASLVFLTEARLHGPRSESMRLRVFEFLWKEFVCIFCIHV